MDSYILLITRIIINSDLIENLHKFCSLRFFLQILIKRIHCIVLATLSFYLNEEESLIKLYIVVKT